MNIEAERAAELVGQLRKRGIRDEHVLAAVEAVPRERFVEAEEWGVAYVDTALPIGCGQTISQPFIVSYMTEQLGVEPDDEVLEIGTGSGYQAAVLARLCRHVYTIERHAPLLDQASRRFDDLGIRNITAIVGDGSMGWPEPRLFDRIIVTAAASSIPQPLVDQLGVGGRMILPVTRPVLGSEAGSGGKDAVRRHPEGPAAGPVRAARRLRKGKLSGRLPIRVKNRLILNMF